MTLDAWSKLKADIAAAGKTITVDPALYFEMRKDQWWACEHPERPADGDKTVYHAVCRACAVAADARARTSGRKEDRAMADFLLAEADNGAPLGPNFSGLLGADE